MNKTYSQTRERIQEYFDQTAVKAWETLTNESPVSVIRTKVRAGREEMRNLILSQMPKDLSGYSILDAGCGTGQMAIELGMRGAEVLGIDISSNLIDIAKKRLPNALKDKVKFVVSDMIQDHGRFEYVILMDSLIHYPVEDIIQILENFLKRTEKKVLFTLVPTNILLKLKLTLGRFLPRSDRSPVLSPLDTKSFIKIFRDGFKRENSFEITSIGRVNKWFYTSEAVEIKR